MLVSRIATLAEFVRFAPEAFEEKSDNLIEHLLKEILLQASSDDVILLGCSYAYSWNLTFLSLVF